MSKRLLIAATVLRERWPSRTVRELQLSPVHREKMPPFTAGDHVQLQHLDGTRRDYSLCGPPSDLSTYTVAIQREDNGRGGSMLFHEGLRAGETVFVSYPQPGISIDDSATHHVLVAGGIGVTAIVGLLEGILANASTEVHYLVRSLNRAPYLDRLRELSSSVYTYSSSDGDRANLDRISQRAHEKGTLYYCGPPRMMAELDALTDDWPMGRARSETFTVAASIGEKRGESFDTSLLLSKRIIHVSETKSLLQAMLDEGIPLDYSCEGGICGSCVVEVVEGDVDHRDLCLSEKERTSIMTACVSRGRGTISIQA